MIRAIETYYNGRLYRSRLEARWAVFFDACGVRFDYEPEGFDLGNGIWYLPDFLLHDVTINHASYLPHQDVFVEVKGNMTIEDVAKIKLFSEEYPLLVVGEIPSGDLWESVRDDISDRCYKNWNGVCEFNFETVDDDCFGAYPGVDLDGGFQLFGDDSNYLSAMDEKLTARAYRLARCARFEHSDRHIRELKECGS